MSDRVARIASAVFAAILTGAPLTAVLHVAADAAENCQTLPGDQTPEGKHWYYRIEHPSNRQCWYLRDEGGGPAQSGVAQRTERAVQPKAETSPPQRSLADAHAELPWPQPGVEQNTPTSMPQRPQAMPADAVNAPTAQRSNVLEGTTRGSLIGTRWPDPAAASTASPQAATPEAIAEAQPDQPTMPAQAAPAAALTTADTPPAKIPASLSTLLMVVAGALALAGLTASAIFRLGARRSARAASARRRAAWEAADRVRQAPPRQSPQRKPSPQKSPKVPPWTDPEKFERRPELAPGFHQASHHNEMDRNEMDHNARLDQISEFLERMSRQPSH
jgi:hypothetical protein